MYFYLGSTITIRCVCFFNASCYCLFFFQILIYIFLSFTFATLKFACFYIVLKMINILAFLYYKRFTCNSIWLKCFYKFIVFLENIVLFFFFFFRYFVFRFLFFSTVYFHICIIINMIYLCIVKDVYIYLKLSNWNNIVFSNYVNNGARHSL